MPKLTNISFTGGFDSLKGMPESNLIEIGVIGRSNVGKSTLVNRLTERRKLAKTSSTPGRTQQINFFEIEGSTDESKNFHFHLVDLPGYGYAKFSKQKRENLSRLTVDYIGAREQLAAMCLLIDVRRVPEKEELALQKLVFNSGVIFIPIVTKIDKLKQKEVKPNLVKIADILNLEVQDLLLAGEKTRTDKIWNQIAWIIETDEEE